MKKIILILSLALTATGAFAQWVDDLYDTTPAKTKKEKSAKSDQSYSYTLAEPDKDQPAREVQATSPSDNQELLTTYQDALQRRLSAMRNAVDMDEAYWQLMQQYQGVLENKYDKNLYNIVVVGNDMWVEPQAITALFDGSDPAEGVIEYNKKIKDRLTGNNKPKSSSSQSSSVSGGGSSSPSITVNLTVDPWSWGGWGYNSWGYNGWGYNSWGPYFGYNQFYDPWYNPWANPWYRPYYNPWYNPYYPTYYPSYPSNPRGTYYGNSASRPPRNQSGGGLGGGRQPRVAGSSDARLTRRELDTRPTGVNTVSGLGNRLSRGEIRSRGDVPTGGVADLRNSGITVDRGRIRPTNNGNLTPTYTRPSNSTYERPNYSRPTTTYDSRQRNTYERPVDRPTPTYQRPTTTYERPTPTYQRPTTTPTYNRPSTPTYSRPSSGGNTSRPMGGGRSR